jgi:hypothetical protein
MAKIFQVLLCREHLSEQERFRQKIDLKHQKKTQKQVFGKWKGRF